MRQIQHRFEITTQGRGLHELTADVARWVAGSGIREGLLTLFLRHTSASLIIQENADPDVRHDLERFFARLVPDGDPLFAHTLEGADDMPAHLRAALTQTQLSIPVAAAAPLLGTWQGIFLYEHRRIGHRREIVAQLLGD